MGSPCNAATYRRAAFDLALAEHARTIIEVGVYAGGLSILLATLPELERLTVVDSWRGDYGGFGQAHMDGIAAQVMTWAAGQQKVAVMRMDSAAAAQLF